ncbi:Fc.00g094730.m01.CDS01 [Cosmosporella sp. VM-42]
MGRVVIEGETRHIAREIQCIESLGAACDYQRRLYGRNASASKHCPRYNPNDPNKRFVDGYCLKDAACFACVLTCPPPGSIGRALEPDGVETSRTEDQVQNRRTNLGPSTMAAMTTDYWTQDGGRDGARERAVVDAASLDTRNAMGMEGIGKMDGSWRAGEDRGTYKG